MRITARLEPNTAQQLEYLVTRLGASTSEVLRSGIDALYKQHAKPDEPVLKYFSKHIGKYDLGDANWSVNYKAELGRILDEKFPIQTARMPEPEASARPKSRSKKQ
jgi:sulfite reductase beta subunit-like hemoprotein